MKVIRVIRTLEEVLERERRVREIRWPYTKSPMRCPRCESEFIFDSDDAKGEFPQVKFHDRAKDVVYLRCPNCGPKSTWDIVIWRKPKHINWFNRQLNDDDYYEHGPLWDYR